MTEERCETCKFWRGYTIGNGARECQRHAPTPQMSGGMTQALWPRTQPSQWCGDWSSIPAPEPPRAIIPDTGPFSADPPGYRGDSDDH